MTRVWTDIMQEPGCLQGRHQYRRKVAREPHAAVPMLHCYPVTWTRRDLERTAQIMFESFDLPGLSLYEQSMCALYACGGTGDAGLVIDIGASTTSTFMLL